jgi:hypothetical protein
MPCTLLALVAALAPASAGPAPPPIIDGEPAGLEDYPMTGAILFDTPDGPMGLGMPTLWCSSTLIAPGVVLTAAHCLDTELLEAYGLGTDSLEFLWSREPDLTEHLDEYDSAWPADAVRVRAWVLHPGYSIWDLEAGLSENHDIALAFLDEPQWDLPTASLMDPAFDPLPEAGLPVEIVGWGQQTPDYVAPEGTVGLKMAGDSAVVRVGETEIQVGLTEEHARQCWGDSGGPVFYRHSDGAQDTFSVIGVTSHTWDDTYCDTYGAVNTRVDAYLDWLAEQMELACDEGLRTDCESPEPRRGAVVQTEPQVGEGPIPSQEPDGDLEATATKNRGCATAGDRPAPLPPLVLLLTALGLARRRGGSGGDYTLGDVRTSLDALLDASLDAGRALPGSLLQIWGYRRNGSANHTR